MSSKTKNIKKHTKRTKDALTLQLSKRHGKAVKKGIRKAKKLKKAVLKAASVSKGKSTSEVVDDFLDLKRLRAKRKMVVEREVSPSLIQEETS